MNELIKITNDKVDGRELHEFLGVKTDYTHWFSRMCEYGFVENIDYWTADKNVTRADGTIMPQKQIDHELTINMAKEVSMIQRNERGKQARLYFIKREEQAKALSKPKTMAELLVEHAQAYLEHERRLAQIEQAQAEQKQELQGIREIVALRPDSWRDDTKAILDKIVAGLGGDSETYRDIRNQSYTELEKRAHCRLKQQLNNAKKRMEERGASKTQINQLRILDMIDKNQRLIEIYLSVVKDMAIHHGVSVDDMLF